MKIRRFPYNTLDSLVIRKVSVYFITKPKPKKLLDRVRDAIRLKHYSFRTEESYIYWIRRYILFHNKQHPKDLGRPEIEAFLTHLAVQDQVAASTQNQAISAILFLNQNIHLNSLKPK